MRWGLFFLAVFFLSAGMGIFVLKYQVEALEREKQDIFIKIKNLQKEVHLLKAEWSYLNDPQRLMSLAQRHLNLEDVHVGKIKSLEQLPEEVFEKRNFFQGNP